jgi:hypothetical protein
VTNTVAGEAGVLAVSRAESTWNDTRPTFTLKPVSAHAGAATVWDKKRQVPAHLRVLAYATSVYVVATHPGEAA